MYLIHVRLRAASPLPCGPPLPPSACRAPVLADAEVEHLTEHHGPDPGTVVVTAFVRAPTLAEAEVRVGKACLALLRPPWTVATLWPGLVGEYYEKVLASDEV